MLRSINIFFGTLLLIIAGLPALAQVVTLDDFEGTTGWEFIRSDAVEVAVNNEEGVAGNAIRFDYEFTKGTGYGGIQKWFPIDLPENYVFTFFIKAESPSNNFEIKFIDSTGNNVWWVSNRNYEFPGEWNKIRIKKRHIEFAWGPTSDQSLKRIDRIEFTVASYVGGSGTLWLDSLTFEPLPPTPASYPTPVVSASSHEPGHSADGMIDLLANTSWKSGDAEAQEIILDFRGRREFGGLKISWLEEYAAQSFEVLLSDNGENWESAYHVASNKVGTSFIRLREAEANFMKLVLKKSVTGKGFGITELNLLDIEHSLTNNDFIIYMAKNSPEGDYPRYFLEQGSYWTLTGVNYDIKEALINEDGMVEVDKAQFSIEPMLMIADSLINWSNIESKQSLGSFGASNKFKYSPAVSWQNKDLEFRTAVATGGTANSKSVLGISYSFHNQSEETKEVDLYLLIRPYQVNPYYQFLNTTGGFGNIRSIEEKNGAIHVDDKIIFSSKKYNHFGAASFDEGSLPEQIRSRDLPAKQIVQDNTGMANGLIQYTLILQPDEKTFIDLVIPFHTEGFKDQELVQANVAAEFNKSPQVWSDMVNHIHFNLPASADPIIKTYRANLMYILVNRDNNGIQPGSRSYERSWIRDGALTSSALLKSGIVHEVRDFINWYADYQFENGKVPCVVDFRGPDPVPEHDSHGELIYLIREYFNFTQDTAFLLSKNKHILKAVDYIESITAERSTDYFRNGNDSIRAFYGLVPESISHEGYSAKPMHSYWDNFFIMKGLKDAAEIQKILGKTESYERICEIRDTFRDNLYNSLDLAMKVRNIDYIPGCVELGDFDATSTTIALTPCNELKNLPKPQVYNTFDQYYTFFKLRRDGQKEWINYTPYENRLIGSFIILDQPDRAHELIEYFLMDQRPQGWYHWAEVVWRDTRFPGFIGDMPHTWVGSDFINAIRSMFVYENEYDQSLVVAAALYQDWIDAPEGMSVEHLPTYYGELSYFIKNQEDHYNFRFTGDLNLPENGIKIKNFNSGRMPVKVIVNGKESKDFTDKEILVGSCPAEVDIYY